MKPKLLLPLMFCLCVNLAATGKGQFDAIDKYAVSAPAYAVTSTGALAHYLKKGCKSESDEARAIFAWVASAINYDYVDYNLNRRPDCSPRWILKNRIAVCAGFSALYKEIADSMGLQTVCINGYAKSYGAPAGYEFTKTNHVWNAAKVDGKWRLIDATWGRNGGDDAVENTVTHTTFYDYWFDTDPTAFVFQHYPKDPQWLLTTQPVSKSEFEKLPFATDWFFKLGFNASAVLQQALAGKAPTIPQAYICNYDIKLIGFPESATLAADTAFSITLESESDLAVAAYNNKQFYRFTRTGNRYTVKIPLAPGDFEIGVRPLAKEGRYSYILKCMVQ